MSKLSFRSRALDPTRPMPILRTEDVPDLPDFAAINRAVPQMPTGMEKEEESEHHLQRAISAQQAFGRAVDHVIPTPEVFPVDDKEYDKLYPPTYKIPRPFIHIQLPSFEQEQQPEYDMDSEDEEFLNTTISSGTSAAFRELTPSKFESIIETFERNSGSKVLEESEAKALVKGDESICITLYDYWLDRKRAVNGRSLLPAVKTERRDGTSGNNPYIAFRRRTEKMQTRKNRKNDETSYEKMLKLRRNFISALEILGLIRKREIVKKDILQNEIDTIEARYKLGDYKGHVYNDLLTKFHKETYQTRVRPGQIKNEDTTIRRKNRKRPKNEVSQKNITETGEFLSSEEEVSNDVVYQGSQVNEQEDDNPDGQYAFKRKRGCSYYAPLNDEDGWYGWGSERASLEQTDSWESTTKSGRPQDTRHRFALTSLSRPPNYCIGFARRRIGRGGRIIFDRIKMSDINSLTDENEWLHFRPVSPVDTVEYPETIRFNSSNFDEDKELPSNDILKSLDEENLFESKLYKYNEDAVSNFIQAQKDNKDHSNTEKAPILSKGASSSGLNGSFIKSIDNSLCQSIMLSIDETSSKANFGIDLNNTDMFDGLDSFDDIFDPMDYNSVSLCNMPNSNLMQSKMDHLASRSPVFASEVNARLLNNGAPEMLPTTTTSASSIHSPLESNATATSSLTPNPTLTPTSSSQNPTTNMTFSSYCKMTLSSPNSSSFHHTDVT